MSSDARKTCPHGVYEFNYCVKCDTDKNRNELRVYRKERRAEWIRNNVAALVDPAQVEDWPNVALDAAEWMADVLEKRGYL